MIITYPKIRIIKSKVLTPVFTPKKVKPLQSDDYKGFCGERGIRTPGPVTVNSFQDCRNRPLCHFSNMSQPFLYCECKYRKVFFICKCFKLKNNNFS